MGHIMKKSITQQSLHIQKPATRVEILDSRGNILTIKTDQTAWMCRLISAFVVPMTKYNAFSHDKAQIFPN